MKLYHSLSVTSGGASAVKKPGHFEVRKSSSQITRMHFFPQKKVEDCFLLVALKTQPANARFTVTLLPKQSNTQGLSQGGGSSSQVMHALV